MDASELKYLELLSKSFPTVAKASAEIVNLNAILNLPKGTEIFASDIHGEYEAFSHLLRNGSGNVRTKIEEAFGDSLDDEEKTHLATLISYPEQKIDLMLSQEEDEAAWYADVLPKLVAVCRRASVKYTRSKVRKALPADFGYIIDELLTESTHDEDKDAYYRAILDAVIRTGSARQLVIELCLLIHRLAIDQLHIVGDIFDRGPYPDRIMDALIGYHNVDVQWGNHDIVWMGAAAGQWGCITHVVRNSARYGNLSILEDSYGINILPLARFALAAYEGDPCVAFWLKGNPQLSKEEIDLSIKIQKAMAVIQFKVEGQLIEENPDFELEHRRLLHLIDYDKGTISINGVEYELMDKVLPTIDPDNPYRLTPEEESVMMQLEQSFRGSEKLQRHMRFFLEKGGLYKVSNGSLLLHACVPLNPDGSLKEVNVFGKTYTGMALYDVLDRYVRAAFYSADADERKRGADLMWWLWQGEGSPLFAKSKMATFELYLVADKAVRKEVKNSFYELIENEEVIDGIFKSFGMDPATSRIVCGHVPVKVKNGEDPVKCGGKVLCIDGGFSRAYQTTTGIAGFTLISNSRGFFLAAHEPLESMTAAVVKELDIHSQMRTVELVKGRTLVGDTDIGADLKQQIADLERLVEAYRRGLIPEA